MAQLRGRVWGKGAYENGVPQIVKSPECWTGELVSSCPPGHSSRVSRPHVLSP